MNSFRSVFRAIDSELARQVALLGRRRSHRAGDARLGRVERRHASRSAAKSKRTTTATFPIRIWPRWSFRRRTSRGCVRNSASCRRPASGATRGTIQLSVAARQSNRRHARARRILRRRRARERRAAGQRELRAGRVVPSRQRKRRRRSARRDVTPQALRRSRPPERSQYDQLEDGQGFAGARVGEGGSPAAIVEREGLASGLAIRPPSTRWSPRGAGEPTRKRSRDYRAGKDNVMRFSRRASDEASRGKANPALAEERLRAFLDGAGSA